MARKIIAQNRKARHEYFIDEVLEAGIALSGTEVKSLRAGRASIAESYATEINGEMYLTGANIQEYEKGNRFNHPPVRNRKLLLRRREINKIIGKLKTKGVTLIPLALYFNERGRAKLSWPGRAARSSTTSARASSSATGTAARRGCCVGMTGRP